MKHLFYLVLFLLGGNALAQQPVKTIIPQRQAWLGYFNQTRLSHRWGVWLDLHARRIGDDHVNRWNTEIIRPGLTYYASDALRFTAGYAYVRHFPSSTDLPVRPEHRIWQQVAWNSKIGRLALMQWLRTEQRYNRRVVGNRLGDDYAFNHRFRFNILAQYPLKGETIRPGVLNAVVQNEVFINAGKEITYNYFDQNRFFVGLSYPFNKALMAQAGYMNLFQQQPIGNRFTSNHTIRLFLFHTLDFREK